MPYMFLTRQAKLRLWQLDNSPILNPLERQFEQRVHQMLHAITANRI